RRRCRALLGVALGAGRDQRLAAMAGSGLDRHLQALAAVANQMKIRPPFLVEVLGHPWALASSPAPRAEPPLLPASLHPAGGGFAPPHPDGYGVCYAWGRGDSITLHICCRRSSP
ncbi:CPT1C palmitoyltransferase, partial [Rhinopomastus cyanomelas]|nr:CPT1C palmitoyltransferase [Rhinopomastus cyanomelas]